MDHSDGATPINADRANTIFADHDVTRNWLQEPL
jgi:hypothetical protein